MIFYTGKPPEGDEFERDIGTVILVICLGLIVLMIIAGIRWLGWI